MLSEITHALVAALAGLAALVLFALAWIEDMFFAAMTNAGIPHQVQSLLALILAVLFLFAAFRLFGGFIRIVLIFVLLTLLVHSLTHHAPTIPRGPISHV